MSRDRTTVFQMRDMLDDSYFVSSASELVKAEFFEDLPHRDYDELAAAVERCDTVEEIAREMGTSHSVIRKWMQAYGFERPRRQNTLASRLDRLDPDDIGGLAD